MSLILEVGYDSVRIQDITDRANLGRATFYLHYRDKEELLVKSLQAVCDDLAEHAQKEEKWAPIGLVAFQHAEKNPKLYRAILDSKGTSAITRQIRDYVIKDIFAKSKEGVFPDFSGNVPMEIYANFWVGALIGLLDWWLERGMPYSAEYMANSFHQMVTSALAGITSS